MCVGCINNDVGTHRMRPLNVKKCGAVTKVAALFVFHPFHVKTPVLGKIQIYILPIEGFVQMISVFLPPQIQ